MSWRTSWLCAVLQGQCKVDLVTATFIFTYPKSCEERSIMLLSTKVRLLALNCILFRFSNFQWRIQVFRDCGGPYIYHLPSEGIYVMYADRHSYLGRDRGASLQQPPNNNKTAEWSDFADMWHNPRASRVAAPGASCMLPHAPVMTGSCAHIHHALDECDILYAHDLVACGSMRDAPSAAT